MPAFESLPGHRQIVLIGLLISLMVGGWSVLQLKQMADGTTRARTAPEAAADMPAATLGAASAAPMGAYVVGSGDRMVDIAQQLCGDYRLWTQFRHTDGTPVTALINPGDRLIPPAACSALTSARAAPHATASAGGATTTSSPVAPHTTADAGAPPVTLWQQLPSPDSLRSAAAEIAGSATAGPLAVPAALASLLMLSLLVRRLLRRTGALARSLPGRARPEGSITPPTVTPSAMPSDRFADAGVGGQTPWAAPVPGDGNARAAWLDAVSPGAGPLAVPLRRRHDSDVPGSGSQLASDVRGAGGVPAALNRPLPRSGSPDVLERGPGYYPSPVVSPVTLDRTAQHSRERTPREHVAGAPREVGDAPFDRGGAVEIGSRQRKAPDLVEATTAASPTAPEPAPAAADAQAKIADYRRDPFLGDPLFGDVDPSQDGSSIGK